MGNQTFNSKKVNTEKLCSYGFRFTDNMYTYETNIAENNFRLTVNIANNNTIKTTLVDLATNELYTLHLMDDATGSFVGKIKEEYNSILNDIINKCFDNNIFKSEQSSKVIEHIQKKYNDEFEYLWEKFPANAIARRKDNQKWYAAILTAPGKLFGQNTDGKIEVIDVRIIPEESEKIIDNKKYFPGYHMNKKHWLTVCLDNSVSDEDIYELIDKSYYIAGEKKKRACIKDMPVAKPE